MTWTLPIRSGNISGMAKTPRDNIVQFVLKDKDARDALQVLFDRFPGRETDSHVYRKIFDLGMRALAANPAYMSSNVVTTPTPDELRALLAAAGQTPSHGTLQQIMDAPPAVLPPGHPSGPNAKPAERPRVVLPHPKRGGKKKSKPDPFDTGDGTDS